MRVCLSLTVTCPTDKRLHLFDFSLRIPCNSAISTTHLPSTASICAFGSLFKTGVSLNNLGTTGKIRTEPALAKVLVAFEDDHMIKFGARHLRPTHHRAQQFA